MIAECTVRQGVAGIEAEEGSRDQVTESLGCVILETMGHIKLLSSKRKKQRGQIFSVCRSLDSEVGAEWTERLQRFR